MLRTHLLFAIGVNTLLQRRDRRTSCHIELDNDHSFTLLCPKRVISQYKDPTVAQKRQLSNASTIGTHRDRSWRRNLLGLIIIVVAIASIMYTMTSPAVAFRKNDEFLVFKVIEIVPEAGCFLRVKAKAHSPTDDQGKDVLRALLTNGHVQLTDMQTKLSCNAVVVNWNVDRYTGVVTFLVEEMMNVQVGSDVEVRCNKAFTLGHFKTFAPSDDQASMPGEKYHFGPRRHLFSFLKLPRHVDRVVMISSGTDIPKLFPIFCRLTGYSSAGVADETNFGAESKVIQRKSVLWIIEADSPQDIPLLNELLHVSKGSPFFDFYVTTKSGWWKWPSGIGRLNENILRHVLPREIINEEPNHLPMLPLASPKFSTGFVMTESIATRLLDSENGDLLHLLPASYDKSRSITIVS